MSVSMCSDFLEDNHCQSLIQQGCQQSSYTTRRPSLLQRLPTSTIKCENPLARPAQPSVLPTLTHPGCLYSLAVPLSFSNCGDRGIGRPSIDKKSRLPAACSTEPLACPHDFRNSSLLLIRCTSKNSHTDCPTPQPYAIKIEDPRP